MMGYQLNTVRRKCKQALSYLERYEKLNSRYFVSEPEKPIRAQRRTFVQQDSLTGDIIP